MTQTMQVHLLIRFITYIQVFIDAGLLLMYKCQLFPACRMSLISNYWKSL